ncbi:MAG: hypothetical protein R3Y52_02785 [Psittacicella sp.]
MLSTQPNQAPQTQPVAQVQTMQTSAQAQTKVSQSSKKAPSADEYIVVDGLSSLTSADLNKKIILLTRPTAQQEAKFISYSYIIDTNLKNTGLTTLTQSMLKNIYTHPASLNDIPLINPTLVTNYSKNYNAFNGEFLKESNNAYVLFSNIKTPIITAAQYVVHIGYNATNHTYHLTLNA